MLEIKILKDAVFTASVISNNMFDELYSKCSNVGSMGVYELISNAAIKFETEFQHVKEWETFLDEQNFEGDWEEFVIKKTKEYLVIIG